MFYFPDNINCTENLFCVDGGGSQLAGAGAGTSNTGCRGALIFTPEFENFANVTK